MLHAKRTCACPKAVHGNTKNNLKNVITSPEVGLEVRNCVKTVFTLSAGGTSPIHSRRMATGNCQQAFQQKMINFLYQEEKQPAAGKAR